jgi:hypothetical protein
LDLLYPSKAEGFAAMMMLTSRKLDNAQRDLIPFLEVLNCIGVIAIKRLRSWRCGVKEWVDAHSELIIDMIGRAVDDEQVIKGWPDCKRSHTERLGIRRSIG